MIVTNRTEALRIVKGRGYFARTEGPEVTCPACGERVQCYRASGKSITRQIDAGMRYHLDGCSVLGRR